MFVLLLLAGCKREWTTHNDITDPSIKLNIFEKIQQDTALSAFSNLLVKSGYDAIIASSQNYTVWAPVNAAIRQVDAAVINNDSLLKLFVGSHISLQSYVTSAAQAGLRIRTLSGKYHNFTATNFDEASITLANAYANNGIVHHINTAIIPQQNIWEYVNAATTELQQKIFLTSLVYQAADSTGKTVVKNSFFERVADVSNEAKQYTYFLLTDDAYNTAFAELKPFFATGSTDSTNRLSAWQLIKDLAVEGLYTFDKLPDTLLSTTQVKIPINKQAIVRSYRASNGIVYVLNKPASRLQDKFSSLIVEGESPVSFSRTDKAANIFYRVKSDAAGNVFRDIEVYGHATALFYIKYQLQNVPAATYKVYWRAVAGNNDAQTVEFQQRVAFASPDATNLAYTTVTLNNYKEVYLGEYTTTSFGTLPLYLVSANSATAGVNTLSLDYLRLEPQF